MTTKNHEYFLSHVISLASNAINSGGLPFAALVVKDGNIVSEGVNNVRTSYDPSDHAEISAIRKACSRLQSSELHGCYMYVVSIPCPMCLSCIILTGIKTIFYAVDVDKKDGLLTKHRSTKAFYELVANSHAASAIDYHLIGTISPDGEKLFARWNSRVTG